MLAPNLLEINYKLKAIVPQYGVFLGLSLVINFFSRSELLPHLANHQLCESLPLIPVPPDRGCGWP